MKCLVIGGSGQVGAQIMKACWARQCLVLGTTHTRDRPDLAPLDIRDADAVHARIAMNRPDVVFLTSAYTQVDAAEQHPAACFAVNADGTLHVAQAVRACRTRLVFFSTDHVFGCSDLPQTEEEPVRPVSVYARSKVAAEECIRALLPRDHLILRTSSVFGPDEQGKNFVYRVVQTLSRGEELPVARDQHCQPTYSPDLASVAVELFLAGEIGTLHVLGPNRMTRHDWARLIARSFDLDGSGIQGRTTAQLAQPAPRPANVWLSTEKLRRIFGNNPIRRVSAALQEMREQNVLSPATEVAAT